MLKIKWAVLAVAITFLLSSLQSDSIPVLIRLHPYIKIGIAQVGINIGLFTLLGLISGIAFLSIAYFCSNRQET
jgi:hypothetical protein